MARKRNDEAELTRIQVVHLSRGELEQRKEMLLGLLQVFELYTRGEVEENLAEVEYLLGGAA